MSRGAVVTIDLKALQDNLARVRELAPHSKVLAMVKSDGYGHGLVDVGKALHQADALGVASLGEARQLRGAGVETDIVVMPGFYDADEIPQLEQYNLQPVIHHPSQLDLLEQAKFSKPIKAWFKIDSGMHRLGFLPDEVETARQRLRKCPAVSDAIILMTHLADADEPSNPFTQQQITQFYQLIEGLPGEKSIANSAGIVAHKDSITEWVRPGIMLYGVSPIVGRVGTEHQLKPVMHLSAKLMAIKNLKAGDKVGYGSRYTCPEDMLVGIVAIGYGDGYPRHAPDGTPALVNNIECPLVGRVSMDMLAIDLRNVPDARIGDSVTLWGEGLPIEKIAERCDTIAYELLCNIAPRVRRHYL